MSSPIRVAFFTDAYLEPNGVASLSREFCAYAERHSLPFLCVHSGAQTIVSKSGSVTNLSLKRGFASFRLDEDLYCDPLLTRYTKQVSEEILAFKPDLIHITGPGDIGILGAHIAHRNKIPLIGSWHTNLHEYAARRVAKGLAFLPVGIVRALSEKAEKWSLMALARFYHIPCYNMAPNSELVELLEERTGKPCSLMLHGVDLQRFCPERRRSSGTPFAIGYVGRLTPEKNVRFFAQIQEALKASGVIDYRLVMVGEGSERKWLEANLTRAELPGVLRGDDLANAFADMDAFVFPSETDTFGLVILEAMASGVPVIVARGGGPQYQVQEGENGFICEGASNFAQVLMKLMADPALRCRMGQAARQHAHENSWNRVFDQVYQAYAQSPALH